MIPFTVTPTRLDQTMAILGYCKMMAILSYFQLKMSHAVMVEAVDHL